MRLTVRVFACLILSISASFLQRDDSALFSDDLRSLYDFLSDKMEDLAELEDIMNSQTTKDCEAFKSMFDTEISHLETVQTATSNEIEGLKQASSTGKKENIAQVIAELDSQSENINAWKSDNSILLENLIEKYSHMIGRFDDDMLEFQESAQSTVDTLKQLTVIDQDLDGILKRIHEIQDDFLLEKQEEEERLSQVYRDHQDKLNWLNITQQEHSAYSKEKILIAGSCEEWDNFYSALTEERKKQEEILKQ